MSTSDSQPDRAALGARGNWWGESTDDDDGDDDHGTPDPDPRSRFGDTNNKHRWIAHQLLRDWGSGPRMACPVRLTEDPDAEYAVHEDNDLEPQTDPVDYVPYVAGEEFGMAEFGVQRHKRRHGRETGYVSYGGTLIPLSLEELQNLVVTYLESIPDFVRESNIQAAVEYATRRKRQDHTDAAILAAVVRAVDNPGFDLDH